jgi:hypothetical protein
LTDSNGEIISITSCATTTTTSSTTTSTTTEAPTTTTTTTTTLASQYYYLATQYLNCVQNSSVDEYVVFSPTAIANSWVCGDDGNQYLISTETTPQVYIAEVLSSAVDCASLSC